MNKMIKYADRHNETQNIVPGTIVFPVDESQKLDSELYGCIFGVDPVTGIPNGDLAVYLSPDTSTEIKDYISQRLLHENGEPQSALSLSQDVLNKFKGTITDDDIAFFSRNDNETREEYANRLRWHFQQERDRVRKSKANEDLKKLLNDSE